MASIDDLWLTDFVAPHPGEPAARRPALILGPVEAFGSGFPFVIVAPLTSRHRGLSLHVEVEASAATGLKQTSYVQCELIRSISRQRLLHRLGAVPPEVGHRVAEVVRTLLGY
jgi:mRNA interferase MazF